LLSHGRVGEKNDESDEDVLVLTRKLPSVQEEIWEFTDDPIHDGFLFCLKKINKSGDEVFEEVITLEE
jgi:hypothetical protein